MERKPSNEYIRIVQGADTAILFVHGIIGTPNHFDRLIPLVPEHVSIYNMLIDGHGQGVLDFGRSSLKRWEASVHKVLDELSKTHEKIYIVGHSMGTLLTMHEALTNKKIAGAFMLAIPITIYLHPKMVPVSFRLVFDRIPPDNRYILDIFNCYGIDQDPNLLKYLTWIPRFIELSVLVHRTRKILPDFNIPCVAYQSAKDEVVFKSSINYLKKHSSITVKTLENSGHYHYPDDDLSYIISEFDAFINPLRKVSEP